VAASLAVVRLPSLSKLRVRREVSDRHFFFFFFLSFLSFVPILLDVDRARGLMLRLRLLEDELGELRSLAMLFLRFSLIRARCPARVELRDFTSLVPLAFELPLRFGKLLLLFVLVLLVSNLLSVENDFVCAVLLLMTTLV